jgi:hypothetical protein
LREGRGLRVHELQNEEGLRRYGDSRFKNILIEELVHPRVIEVK